MHVEYLIIGQGVSGTFLSYYLYKAKKSFAIVDAPNPNSSSRIAAGIINPVTGRRMVTVWMADQILPFARNAYNEIGEELGITAISQKDIIDFFPNPFMRENFLKRLNEGNEYLQSISQDQEFRSYFNYEFGCGAIRPVLTVHLESLSPAWRTKLIAEKFLIEAQLEMNNVVIDDRSVVWSPPDSTEIEAQKIIFCDGAAGFTNPYFKQLPFAANKGEALLVEIPGLPASNIYKKSITLVPMEQKDMFWAGSSYEWHFVDADPTEAFRKSTVASLQQMLKCPFNVLDHKAAVRPATLERRPFVGFHPKQKNVGILNGMGTKGCSLAPFFANQLVQHILYSTPISQEAGVARFQRILSRKTV